MKNIQIKSPAKLNLCLEVVKKYKNGFHEINSVFVKSKNLYDEICIEFSHDNDKINIICDDKSIPTNNKNICWMIAERYFEKIGKKVGITIDIKKRIPPLAGLGGGSSNGASVLLVLNNFYNNLLSKKELVEIASEIGKDIPFFLNNSIASYVSGAGEEVITIEGFPKLNILVVFPNVEISTLWAYKQLDKLQWFMNDNRRKKIALTMKNDAKSSEDVAKYVYNDFSLTAMKKSCKIEEIKNAMESFGAMSTSISGKGPTTFGIFKSEEELEFVNSIFKKEYKDFFIAKF